MNSGLKNAATARLRPIIKPIGTAKTMATTNPIAMRLSDARILTSVSGSLRRFGSSRSGPQGGGSPLTAKARESPAQISNNAMQAISAESPGIDLTCAIS